MGVEKVESPVSPGDVLDGKFRVERVVGVGGMGIVLEATNLGLDERVALKFLLKEALERPDIVSRFAREARAAVKLKSEHVARVYDVGSFEGQPYIVMEYLRGSDLADVLTASGRLSISDAVEYVIQACEGLGEAHARGIVHRDIKPANLFLVKGDGALRHVKLLDFGISKAQLLQEGRSDLATSTSESDTNQMMGSPQYMSPEQMRSTRDVDGRADIWSLGVVLYELLSGRIPFPGETVTLLISQILHDPPEPLRSHAPHVPPELDAIVSRCLEKEAADRFQSAADLAIALLPFAPKRSRSIVERIADVARSSGRISANTPELHSLPPPANPSSGHAPVSVPSRPTPAELSATIHAAESAPLRTSPPSKRGWMVLAPAVLFAAAVLALYFAVRQAPPVSAAAAVPPPPTVTTPIAPTTSSALPTASASPVEIPSATPAATAISSAPAKHAAHPVPRPTSSATTNATKPPDGEIQRER